MTRHDADKLLAQARADRDSDWPYQLLANIHTAPLIPEHQIEKYVSKTRGRSEHLTDNQKLVLMYASRGLREQEIADVTCLTKRAVADRLRECRTKMAGKTTTHAACNAIREGLIP